MKLSNDKINSILLNGLGITIGDTMRLKNIWGHLVTQGYREDLIKFMEVPEVRFPKEANVQEETLLRAFGAQPGANLRDKKFMIQAVEIMPVEETDEVEKKGRYKVECTGNHFDTENDKWSDKMTILFSLRLQKNEE